MVVKSTSKSTVQKKAVKPSISSRQKKITPPTPEKNNFQEIIDLHTKHLLQLDEMISSLQKDVSDIRNILVQEKKPVSRASSKPTASAVKVTPGKTLAKKPKVTRSKTVAVSVPQSTAIQKAEKKELSAPVSTKSIKTPVKSTKKTLVKTPVKTVKKPVVTSVSEAPVTIPSNIADRINALTAKKIVNQTQLGADSDLPQNIIHEISTRKLKRISPVSIEKITAALKKYETK